ncbi:hypothetical protein BDW59DRAFT_110418 [Aspergillus cavernicola]|uniref:Zn(2)-C6 fungal-type domain-containing protein n=1 Tax=Aspergillus cavernicola TaxID=176166 RepID=A0ABR4I3C8_9EURO
MGGIPYTSTGCNTCRRRKVKCDETKPECMRCTKHGHQCTGYDRKTIFVRGHTRRASENSQTLGTDSECLSAKGSRLIPRLNVNPELRSQLLATFIVSYLPPSHYLRDNSGRNLFQTFPDITGGSAILEKAVISLSAVYLAKQNQDDRLLQYSTKLYGITLRTLHGRITSGVKLGQDVLYTTVLLQIYELINCSPPGFMAWIAHVQGSTAILDQSSTQGNKTVAENLFHRQLRFVTLCNSVGRRKAPYLYKTPAWRSGSSHSKTNSNPIDEFIDLLAECSAVMEQVDQFCLMQPSSSEEASRVGDQLLLDCLKLEENPHRVSLSMQEKLGAPEVSFNGSVPQGDFRDSLHTDLFPRTLGFPSLTCAESHLVYWTILILLYPLIGELSSVLDRPARDVSVPIYSDSANGESGTKLSLGHDATIFTALADHYAGEICRSVLYVIQPDMKTLGAQMLLAPLSQCLQFFHVEQSTAKLKWCQDVFVALQHLGLGIAPLLKDMVWPQYRTAHGRRLSAQKLLHG